jgi:hypothetical protein
MGRKLVWLENSTFAAWGCEDCAWIMPPRKVSGEPTNEVQEAFNKHECAKFPRTLSQHRSPLLFSLGKSSCFLCHTTPLS